MTYEKLPLPSAEQDLSQYLKEIQKFPMLEKEQEYQLAKNWIENQDRESAHKLVTSHLRLAAKIANGYRGYGLPQADIISEANIGLMQAVKRFDPEKGFRLSTYAMWWIRASIQEFVLRSWSLVKIGTTSAQKKLFFNLQKIKKKINMVDSAHLSPDQIKYIATALNVSEDDVTVMNERLSAADTSLNAQINAGEDTTTQWQDWIIDDRADHVGDLEHTDEMKIRNALLKQALTLLNKREYEIIRSRRLQDKPQTLEALSKKFNVSRERIRQIEIRAFEKLQSHVQELAAKQGIS